MHTTSNSYVRYSDALDVEQPSEAEDRQETLAAFERISRFAFEKHRHGLRGAHAKSHGILKGELEIYDGLPDEFLIKILHMNMSARCLSIVGAWLFMAATAAAQYTNIKVGAVCSANAASAHQEGSRYNNKGEYEKAAAVYRRAILAEPTCGALYNNLGSALNNLQNYQEAIAAFQHALRLDARGAWVYNYGLGKAYHSLGQLENAIKAYSEVISLEAFST